MKKEFNECGLCVPKKHYMVDTTPQLKETIELIEKGKYFIINRPRQFGKTTTLSLLENSPKLADYIVLFMSFENTDKSDFATVKDLIEMIIDKIDDCLSEKEIDFDISKYSCSENCKLRLLSKFIKQIINSLDKKVVLIIDEVDQASNNEMFIKFLGALRDKFLNDKENTFHSVVLAGLHDVKNLKLKLRPDEEATYNSPWNIAISYDVDMTFSAKQIETMLVEYKSATNANLNIAKIAEKLYYHTSGYPYFVSKLCKIIDEKIKPVEWKEIDILQAIKILLSEKHNANFDTLVKNLKNNPDLKKFIQELVMNSKDYTYSGKTSIINFAEMHGLIKNQNGKVAIQNRIYVEVITDLITSELEFTDGIDVVQSQFLKTNGNLDIELLLTKFKDAIEEKYSKSDLMKSKEFLENDLRMKFFMFLKPVLNGIGFIYKEVQISEEKRLDAIILFNNEKFIIELKLWKGDKLHKQGIEQIKDYMKREKVDKGYMIIMNKNLSKEYKTTDEDGIFTAWV